MYPFEDAPRALDRMPYPEALMHARTVLYGARRVARTLWLRIANLAHRTLRVFGFRAQRFSHGFPDWQVAGLPVERELTAKD